MLLLSSRSPSDADADDASLLDESEGSVVAALISQLRSVLCSSLIRSTRSCSPQSRDGSLPRRLPYLCSRAQKHAGAHHRLHGFSRSPLWVRPVSSFSLQSLTLLPSAEKCNDPEERFLRVLQYYLAGWHIKPKGVKKPCVFFPAFDHCTTISQLQSCPRRILPLSLRLSRWLSGLLHR